MGDKNILGIVAIILFIIALFTLVYTVMNTTKESVTGKASGFVNITVHSRLEVNLSVSQINWSEGSIEAGQTNATLYTSQTSSTVERGNWSDVSDPDAILIENTGNVNVTIAIQATNNASGLFGSNLIVGEQEYKWNVTNKEAGSCTSNSTSLDVWVDANITSGGQNYCTEFGYDDSADEIYLDVLLTVPYNMTASYSSDISDIITITAGTS